MCLVPRGLFVCYVSFEKQTASMGKSLLIIFRPPLLVAEWLPLNNSRILSWVSNVLGKLEAALLTAAEIVTPEGTEPRAVIHQWLYAIAYYYDLPLFVESKRVDKASLIEILKKEQLFKGSADFFRVLTANLPIIPPVDPKFTLDLF